MVYVLTHRKSAVAKFYKLIYILKYDLFCFSIHIHIIICTHRKIRMSNEYHFYKMHMGALHV